jgi:hypothetical protein
MAIPQGIVTLAVPALTAVIIFLLRPRLRDRPVAGGCLSSIAATIIIAALFVPSTGVTSTLPLGLVFTGGITFIVSAAILAALRAFRSP